MVPIIYSLNRGLWIALIFAVVYIAVRLAATGRLAVLGGLVAGLVIVGVLIGATPLQGMIGARLANGASDSRRGSLAVTATQDAVASPLVGFGDTRHQQGSVQSVTVGRSVKCPTCGNGTIGGNGQLWLLFICNGFLGAALYLGFFAYGVGRFWRDDAVGARGCTGRAADVHLHVLLRRGGGTAWIPDALVRPALAERPGPRQPGAAGPGPPRPVWPGGPALAGAPARTVRRHPPGPRTGARRRVESRGGHAARAPTLPETARRDPARPGRGRRTWRGGAR